MGEWEVGPWMPAELRALLVAELDAQDGDTIVLYPDGSVALGRQACPEAAACITSLLRRVFSAPGDWRRRRRLARDSAHLKLVQ